MKRGSKLFCVVFLAATLLLYSGGSALAQMPEVGELPPDLVAQRRQAPMKAIFNNVLWGSVAGAVAWAGLHLVDDSKTSEERYVVSSVLSMSVTGATYGGMVGLGVGIYMSLMGITFEDTIMSINFSPAEEINYHEQQRQLYGNRKIAIAKRPMLSLQIRF